MKTILLATAAAALFAAPAFAQDAVGSVGVTYSNPSIEVAGNDVDADVWTVDGTVALPAADWTVTLNGAVDYTKAFNGDTNSVTLEPIANLGYLVAQIHKGLAEFTEGESWNMISNCKKNGLEAWRRLRGRFDPATGGRKRNLLRNVLNPGQCSLENLGSGIERWEELVARYEQRLTRDRGE